MLDLGISEALNKIITGRDARTPHNDALYSNYRYNEKGVGTWPLDYTKQPSSGGGQPSFSPYRAGSKPSYSTPTSGSGNKQSSYSGGSGTKSTGSGKKSFENGGLADQQKRLRNSIKNSFSSTINNYKNAIGDLPGDQQDSMAQIENLAGTQITSINDALNAALEKFGGYREEVATNQKATLQDLSNNTRNLFQAGNNYLGARGAGNSSATGMYSAALTQQANRQRADVQNQTNDQYNDLNVSEQDTRNQAQQNIDSVQTWKATQTQTIVQQYQDLKRQLEAAYANANDMQKQAIAQLNTQLYNQAAASLSNIQSVASQFNQQLGNQIGQQMQQTGQMTGAIGQVANQAAGTVQEIQAIPLEGIEQGQSMTDGTIIGYYGGRKVRVDQNGNLLAYLD
jgi:hypothetical protein